MTCIWIVLGSYKILSPSLFRLMSQKFCKIGQEEIIFILRLKKLRPSEVTSQYHIARRAQL